jgi:hypothetical protein
MATPGKRKKEKQYRVFWEIDVWAKTPRAAAKQALEIQRDPESIATHFRVRMRGGRMKKDSEIDLLKMKRVGMHLES